jgi:hypothetical protein
MSEGDIRDLQVTRSLLLATISLARSLMNDARLAALESNLKALSVMLGSPIFYRMLHEVSESLRGAFASMTTVAALAENFCRLISSFGDMFELSGRDARALVESLRSIDRHMKGLKNVSRMLDDMAAFISSEMDGLEDPDFFSRVVETSESHMEYSRHLVDDENSDEIYMDLSDDVYLGDLSDFEDGDSDLDSGEELEVEDEGNGEEAE